MFPTTRPIHFSSTIRVVSDEEFQRLPLSRLRDQGLSVDLFEYTNRLPFTEEGITEGACNCNIGGVQNTQHASFFHMDSQVVNDADEVKENLIKALEDDIQQLKKENPNLRAFLSGGWPEGYGNPEFKELLLGIFRRQNIPVSILWGQSHEPINAEKQGTALHYSAKTDTWTVRVGWKKEGENKTQIIHTLQELKDSFTNIHIDEGDQLFIGDKEIDPREVNTI